MHSYWWRGRPEPDMKWYLFYLSHRQIYLYFEAARLWEITVQEVGAKLLLERNGAVFVFHLEKFRTASRPEGGELSVTFHIFLAFF